jgi:hypothetical protein
MKETFAMLSAHLLTFVTLFSLPAGALPSGPRNGLPKQPPFGEILSDKAINGVLHDIATAQARNHRGPKVTLHAAVLQQVNVAPPVVYDVGKQELVVNGHRASVPLRDGKVDVRILADRTAFEVFASGGQTYVPLPIIPKADVRSVEVSMEGDAVTFHSLAAYEMRSIWAEARAHTPK